MRFLTSSIRSKIIFPYILLTLLVGMAGAYLATRFVFNTVVERLDNQLVGAGQVAGKTILEQETERLTVLRQVSRTEGVATALHDADYARLESLIRPIILNASQIDSIVLLDETGSEAFKLNRNSSQVNETLLPAEWAGGTDYTAWAAVPQVLQHSQSETNDKHTVLAHNDTGEDLLYTLGPVFLDNRTIGVVMVGSYLSNVLEDIRLKSLADITFYGPDGQVHQTTFAGNQAGIRNLLTITPEFYAQVVEETTETRKERVILTGQEYALAFAPFQLRGVTLGVYSVGLRADFVSSSGIFTRNLFTVIVFLAITVLLLIALIVTQQIIRPLAQLVRTSGAIAAGDLNRRTGIKARDEIGRLATSFDQMTSQLRKRSNQLQELLKLREEEASTVRAILSSIADGVLVQDRSGNILEMNPAAEKILHQLAEAFHVQPDPIKEINPQTNASAGPDEERPRRFQIGNRALSARSAPVITTNNTILGSVIVLRDITLEVESEQLKNRFIESISHELLTPLVPIKGYLQLLGMISQANEKQEELIAKIEHHVEDLHDLITTLIDVSQIEGNALGLDLREFDFEELFQDVGSRWVEKMEARQLDFHTHLPTLDVSLDVLGDRNRLKNVLNSLLDNASTYTPAGGRVDLYLKQENGYIQVDVVDTGIGIEESTQPHIFTRFVRAPARDDDNERGAGLQLFIAREVVTQHKGKIWFKTEVNQGSTFSFVIPLADTEPAADQQDEEAPEFDDHRERSNASS